jgi:hypothetical protein
MAGEVDMVIDARHPRFLKSAYSNATLGNGRNAGRSSSSNQLRHRALELLEGFVVQCCE